MGLRVIAQCHCLAWSQFKGDATGKNYRIQDVEFDKSLRSNNRGIHAQVNGVATSLDLEARLKLLAQPVSLSTGESSDGQEDYMSMAIPAISRLYEMSQLSRAMLAYELLAGITAVRMREQTPGDGVAAVVEYFAASIAPFEQDRSPAADIETILQHFNSAEFTSLSH